MIILHKHTPIEAWPGLHSDTSLKYASLQNGYYYLDYSKILKDIFKL